MFQMSTRFQSFFRNSAPIFAFSLALSALPFFAPAHRLAAQTSHPAAISSTQQQFQQPSVISTGSWPISIESADLNGDGHPDLIYTDPGATSTASTTHVLLNNGDGAFTPGQTISTAGSSVVVADFDRDGHPDLEWVSSVLGLGCVFFAHGNGDGTFAPTVQLGTFAQVGTNVPQLTYLAAAPMHPSGYLDLLVEDVANSSLIELTADSSGTLVRLYAIRLPDGTGPMFTADLNGDGNTDLVIQSTPIGGSATTTTADVFFGNPDGILTSPTSYPGPTGIGSMILQDVDADGHPDLLIEGATGHIDILHGLPDGTFATTSEGGTNSLDPTTGAGGHLIALTASRTLYTATPAGISALQLPLTLSATLQGLYNAGPSPGSVTSSYAVADFNGDGTPDLAIDSPDGIAIVFSNPDGTLQTSLAFSVGQPAITGALGSFTSSGKLDAVVTTSATQAKLLPGNGDGTFGSPTAIPAPTPIPTPTLPANLTGLPTDPNLHLASVVTADLDGDGHPDLIAAFDNATANHAQPSASTPNQLLIWYGNPDGTYTTPIVITPSRNYTQIAAADMQNDGLPDLILTDGYLVSILPNLGPRSYASGTSNPEQHLLAGAGITSISTADINSDGATDLVLSNGAQSNGILGTPAATPDVSTGGITVLLNHLTAKAVTGAITASPNTTLINQSYTITASIKPMSSGLTPSGLTPTAPTATGTITFAVDGVDIGTVPISSGAASITSPGAASAGTHTLTARYSGDSVYAGAMLNTPHAVTGISTTIALILTTPTTISYGQTVDGYAQVQASDNSTLAGAISFYDGATAICTIPVTATVTCPASAGAGFITGQHILTAVYSGDTTHAGSTSTPVTVTVQPDATTATLATSLNPAPTGQTLTLTATLTGSFATPTGPIAFLDNGALIGTATLNSSGNAILSTSALTAGTHLINAVYAATPNFNAATTAVLTQLITPASNAAATATMVSSSANPSVAGQSVTLTANVVPVTSSKVAPTGTVTFTDSTGSSGNVVLGTATLSSAGLATFTSSTLALGNHYITATYSGDATSAPSISPTFTQLINSAALPPATSFVIYARLQLRHRRTRRRRQPPHQGLPRQRLQPARHTRLRQPARVSHLRLRRRHHPRRRSNHHPQARHQRPSRLRLRHPL